MTIVRITNHPNLPAIVLVHTPPDLAHEVMGPYQPARYSKAQRAYLLGEEHLEQFERHLARHDVRLADERRADGGPEKISGPLPECDHCGQVVRRAASPAFCPACGREWNPATLRRRSLDMAPRGTCSACEREQAGTFAFCTVCGGAMVRVPVGKRPDHVPRPKLAQPLTLDDVIESSPDLTREQLQRALDEDERDFAQRAAGDR
jgi:hypothetical protein